MRFLLPPALLPVDLLPANVFLGAITGFPEPEGHAPLGDFEVLTGFVTQLLAPLGEPLPVDLDVPDALIVTLGAATAGELPTEDLVLALWTPEGWLEVPHLLTGGLDGTLTLTAPLRRLGLHVVLHAPTWGTLSVPPAPAGVTLAAWGGGSLERLAEALDGGSAWVLADGQWWTYRPGSPPFVNAAFLANYAHGLPAGTPMVVMR